MLVYHTDTISKIQNEEKLQHKLSSSTTINRKEEIEEKPADEKKCKIYQPITMWLIWILSQKKKTTKNVKFIDTRIFDHSLVIQWF